MKSKETLDSSRSENQHKPPERAISRRNFVAGGAAAIGALAGFAPLIVPRHVLGGEGFQAPSNTLAIAAVGVGGMGRNYLAGCQGERIVALCDLDHNRQNTIDQFKKYPDATRYHDFREMFDKEAKIFDALIVATPDHTHTVILMPAIELGKHIYCGKPITHSIGEARKVRQAVAAAKQLVTKSSVQSSGTDGARSTAELLMSGVIGPIHELHIWCDHPAYPCSLVRPAETQTPPQGMDWDLWIGPAPYRPFNSAYHPENWRPWWDFGSGTVGDMGCHTFHIYFKELKLGAPKTIYGYSSTRNDGFFKPVATPECQSNANMVVWEFPARGDMPPLNVYWYDGGMKPHRPAELDHGIPMPRSGLLFMGEKGKLMTAYYGGSPFRRRRNEPEDPALKSQGLSGGLLLPEYIFHDFPQTEKTLPRVENHYLEWTQACKTGTRTVCPIEFGCELTEMALLGALALRTGKTLEWNSDTTRITNDDQANSLIDPPYRTGWSL